MTIEEESYRWRRKGEQPKRESVIALFVFGFLLMGLPVIFVAYWPSGSDCVSGLSRDICTGTEFYGASVRFLPYVMLIGGVLVGWVMKRIADWNTLEPVGKSASFDQDNTFHQFGKRIIVELFDLVAHSSSCYSRP